LDKFLLYLHLFIYGNIKNGREEMTTIYLLGLLNGITIGLVSLQLVLILLRNKEEYKE
jgi:hypothetical protein